LQGQVYTALFSPYIHLYYSFLHLQVRRQIALGTSFQLGIKNAQEISS